MLTLLADFHWNTHPDENRKKPKHRQKCYSTPKPKVRQIVSILDVVHITDLYKISLSSHVICTNIIKIINIIHLTENSNPWAGDNKHAGVYTAGPQPVSRDDRDPQLVHGDRGVGAQWAARQDPAARGIRAHDPAVHGLQH